MAKIDSKIPWQFECEKCLEIDFCVCDSTGGIYLIIKLDVYYYND